MVDIGPTTNGSRRSIHINAATIGAVASTIGVLVYAIGFVSGALVLKSNVSDLQAGIIQIQRRQDAQSELIVSNREDVANRLTKLEAKADYTTQGIADLKALKAGTGR